MPFPQPSSVLITGACGNIGRKLIAALAGAPWCETIVGLDRAPDPASFAPDVRAKLRLVAADLGQADESWGATFAGVDAVVHLAADNPNVDATWQQATNSFDQTVKVTTLAMRHGVRRLVFASSNHVMGRYKDAPLAAGIGPGTLATALPPAPGTVWHDGTTRQDATAYATAKLMGERLVTQTAASSEGRLSAVSIRIGWAQPGANRAATISHAGSILGGFPDAGDDQARRDLRWFRDMWLANPDLTSLFLAAVTADPAGWPTPGIVVNGMSNNRGMPWDIATTGRLLGYRPVHDLYAEIDA